MRKYIRQAWFFWRMKRYQELELTEAESIVLSAAPKDGFIFAEIDDTIFYPGGGGQPCDKGRVIAPGFEAEVAEVYKEGERIVHKLVVKTGKLEGGQKVQLYVDKARRLSLARMHTGEHILYKSIERIVPQISLDKINLDENESSLFIKAPALDWETLLEAEKIANSIIGEDLPLGEREVKKDELESVSGLRIKEDKIKSEIVRVISIGEFDNSACTGVHLKSTGQVGSLCIVGFGLNHGSYEIRFATGKPDRLMELAGISRKAASQLGTDYSNLLSKIEKMRQEIEDLKERNRKLSFEALAHSPKEMLGRLTFISKIVYDVDRKQIFEASEKLLSERTAVLFVNVMGGRAEAALNLSLDLDVDALKVLLPVLSKYGGKGGGKVSFATGCVEEKYAQEVLSGIRAALSSLAI